MKVSVVLTTYNRARFISDTIESILNQSYRDFELIISDNCSTDNTEQICRAYEKKDSRIRYRCNSKNLGMPGNLNAGILASSGEFIANLFDGDLYDSTLLEKWSRALDRYPKVAFVFNAYCELDDNGIKKAVFRQNLPECFSGHILLESIFFRRWQFDSPVFGTVMARRSAYDEAGLFQERFGFFSDVDMWMRLAEKYEVAYINEPLIFLPSKKMLPRKFKLSVWEIQRLLERMFWETRVRHYQGRPVHLAMEAFRHGSFVVASRSWQIVLFLRRFLLNAVKG